MTDQRQGHSPQRRRAPGSGLTNGDLLVLNPRGSDFIASGYLLLAACRGLLVFRADSQKHWTLIYAEKA
jgi:hypothetical protein